MLRFLVSQNTIFTRRSHFKLTRHIQNNIHKIWQLKQRTPVTNVEWGKEASFSETKFTAGLFSPYTILCSKKKVNSNWLSDIAPSKSLTKSLFLSESRAPYNNFVQIRRRSIREKLEIVIYPTLLRPFTPTSHFHPSLQQIRKRHTDGRAQQNKTDGEEVRWEEETEEK